MDTKRAEQFEWVFLAALIIPVVILGKMRMHQQDLARFLIISLICIRILWLPQTDCESQQCRQRGHS